MSNYLEGVFHPAYSFDSITGFQTILNTSLEGNVTIGNLNTSFDLLLNGVPISTGGGPSAYEWSEHPAVQYVMIDGYDISGISTFNGMDVTFIDYSATVGIGNNNLSGNTGLYVNAIGNYAGSGNTGSGVNAIGRFTASGNSGSDVNAMGYAAAYLNAGSNVNAFGINAAYNNSGSNVNAFGTNVAYENTGSYVNALGYEAGSSNAGSYVNAIGYSAAQNNSGNYVNALGYSAAQNNSGDYVNALGYSAAQNNSGDYVNALGYSAGVSNTGSNVNMFGNNAGKSNSGNEVNAIGDFAGISNKGQFLNAIGSSAAQRNSGSNVNAIGQFTATDNSGDYLNTLGYSAALGNTGDYVNALGYNAGSYNLGSNCTFLGYNPNTLVSNTFNNRFIAYSTNSNSPFLYGDTSNNQLSIGTSNLSANLTISGSLFATGSVYDSSYSPGTSGQILSSTGSGTKWIASGGSGLTNPLTTTLDAGNQQIINLASPTTLSGACTIGDCQTIRWIKNPSSTAVLFPYGQPISLKTGMSSEVVGNDINTCFMYPEWEYTDNSWAYYGILPPVSVQFNIKLYSSDIPTVPLVCSATFVSYDNANVVINKIYDTTEFVFIAKNDDSGERYFGGSGILTSTESQTVEIPGNAIHPSITFQFGGYTSDVSFNINALNPKSFVEMIFRPLTNFGNGF